MLGIEWLAKVREREERERERWRERNKIYIFFYPDHYFSLKPYWTKLATLAWLDCIALQIIRVLLNGRNKDCFETFLLRFCSYVFIFQPLLCYFCATASNGVTKVLVSYTRPAA